MEIQIEGETKEEKNELFVYKNIFFLFFLPLILQLTERKKQKPEYMFFFSLFCFHSIKYTIIFLNLSKIDDVQI